MMRFALKKLQRITGGSVAGGDTVVQGMSHDTRSLEPGNLFAALPGTHVDGHDFIAAAADAGAAAALVARRVEHALPQLVVEEPLKAMGAIAKAWRTQVRAQVIGITGSNGKTTVKEMLAAILRIRAPVLATEGNYNNEIGLPLTLARLDDSHRYAVLEMGASAPGDIAYLADIACPAIGLVTNAGPAHLEGFGSLEGVARTKGEMFEALPEDGIAIVNRDDAHYPQWSKTIGGRRCLSFGFHPSADVRADNGANVFHTPAGDVAVALQLPGRHNLANALAAAAAALALEIPLDDIASALAGFHSLPGRLDSRQAPGGWVVIDDTYNANPASLYAGLSVLVHSGPETWLVLGDMGELGEDTSKLHVEMGQAARDLGVSRLFAVGEHSLGAVSAFGGNARHFGSQEAMSEALLSEIHAGVCCLIKGSRFMGMEKVVAALMEERG